MPIHANALICLVIFAAWSDAVARDRMLPEYCLRLLKSMTPTAILIGPDGKESSGPLEFGRFPVRSSASGGEDVHFPTGHSVVISPQQIRVHNLVSDGYSVRLDEIASSLCPRSRTYIVNLYMNFKPGSIRPYKFSDEFPKLSILDRHGYEVELNNSYRFDARLFGELVEPEQGEGDALAAREALRSKPKSTQ